MFWSHKTTNDGSKCESVRPEDLEFLRQIRGRFTGSQRPAWFLILFFGVGCPFFMCLAFFGSSPGDRLTFLILAIVYLALAILIWRLRATEYEFNGEEIIQRQRGKPLKRLTISQITKIDMQSDVHQMRLTAGQIRMVVVMFDSLKEAIRNSLSPEELQQVEQVRAAIEQGRRKMFWVYWLIEFAVGVFTLVVLLAVAMLVIYLGKYFKP